MPKNESELRAMIFDALDGNPAVFNLENTHGAHEFGMDFIFDIVDGFGRMLKCGIQAKSGDIDPATVATCLGQLSVAFTTEFSAHPRTGYLDIAYIVTDGNMSQAAVLHSTNARIGFRNVQWIFGDELATFLKKYGGRTNFGQD